jgi:ribosomal-protein-serine acetyltransferase
VSPRRSPPLEVPKELWGPRVLLRPLTLRDAPAVWEAIEESRERLAAWLPWVSTVRSLDDERLAIAKIRGRWKRRESLGVGVFDQATGRYLGESGLHQINWDLRIFEIGYFIRTSAEGRGYIAETVQLLTRFAFDRLRANRVEIYVDPRNVRSARVPERLGFVLEGTLRRFRADGNGRPADRQVFALIREDYRRLSWRGDRGV